LRFCLNFLCHRATPDKELSAQWRCNGPHEPGWVKGKELSPERRICFEQELLNLIYFVPSYGNALNTWLRHHQEDKHRHAIWKLLGWGWGWSHKGRNPPEHLRPGVNSFPPLALHIHKISILQKLKVNHKGFPMILMLTVALHVALDNNAICNVKVFCSKTWDPR